jgi:hypothetical protein
MNVKTRFDYADVWVNGLGEAIPVSSMETTHLLNTVKMLVQKPERVMSILISDIENASFSEVVWSVHNQCDRKQSLQNVTSLTDTKLVEYVKGTPLFESMLAELEQRGVNTENVLHLCSGSGLTAEE